MSRVAEVGSGSDCRRRRNFMAWSRNRFRMPWRLLWTAILLPSLLHVCSALARPASIRLPSKVPFRIRVHHISSTVLTHEYTKERTTRPLRQPSRSNRATIGCPPDSSRTRQSAHALFRKGSTPVLLSMLAWTAAARVATAASSLTWQQVTTTKSLYRMAKQILLVYFVITASLKALSVSRRQAIDATSEWGRYARHPSSRGRALGWLVLRVTAIWMVSRVVTRRQETLLRYSGDLLADGLLKIGPLYIKIGQIVSCRDDLLPKPWVKSLEKLQDQVPSKKGDDALDLAYNAWESVAEGKDPKEDFAETFSEFDTTPIAAASLGQVHKAKLRQTGDVVAVKLQRAYLHEIYDQDLAMFKKIARTVDKLSQYRKNKDSVSQSWTDIFNDAEKILYREIDYRDEAENGARFCQDFGIDVGGQPAAILTATAKDGSALPSAASWLRAPYVYTDLCSEKVLVMEYVPSIKVTDAAKLAALNVTLEDREYLADMLGRSYLRQFCCNLFFSTDPHPGNLGVEILDPAATTPSDRVRLVFYDFGQAATLTQRQADGILTIIDAIVDMDVDRSIEAFEQMGVLKEDADLVKVRAKVAENYKTGKITTNRKRIKKRQRERGQVRESYSSVTTESDASNPSKDSEVMKYFTLPTEYAFVGRALSQMGGVGKALDPDFDFISSAAPWIFEIKGTSKFLREAAEKWLSNACEKIETFLTGVGVRRQDNKDEHR